MSNYSISWAIQNGLLRTVTGKLQSLWIETPGRCNLACPYCFACGGEALDKENLMDEAQIMSILEQAKAMGVESVGIPGAGEPLLPSNLALTMRIIQKCADLGMFVSLFTTGEFLTRELARKLFDLPVELLIKCNALDPDLQDRFVSDLSRGREIKDYGTKRNACVQMLMEEGFSDRNKCQSSFGRKSRLALVTPIMSDGDDGLSNLAEIERIFRFCRDNNIIFDCDSVLKRGRGASCHLHANDVSYKAVVAGLQRIDREVYGNDWPLSQSYVGGAPCDRYHHHLYVTQYGEIHPCIGSLGVKLGNVRKTTLQQAWDTVEMGIIRSRSYGGVCGEECANFSEGSCNSCLGRRTVNLTNESLRKHLKVQTIGCWNCKKK